MNVAELLLAVAEALGCDTAFSLTGGMSMYLNRAAHESRGIDVVYCHQETSCVSAAEGYVKARDFRVPGLAVITSGPAVSNAMTGMLSANGDSCPVLVLAGQVKTADIDSFGTRTHGVQEIHTAGIVPPAVKTFIRVTGDNLRGQVEEILDGLLEGRPGVVFAEVPLDVQSMDVVDATEVLADVERRLAGRRRPAVASGVDPQSARLLKALQGARRPAVMLGNGVRIAGADTGALLRRLDEAGVPRLYTWLSFDMEPSEAALNLGCPGGLAAIFTNRRLQEADVVVIIGCRMDLATTAFDPKGFAANALRFVVDVDPAELRKLDEGPDTVLLQRDATEVVGTIAAGASFPSVDPLWTQLCVESKVEYLAEEEARLATPSLTVREVALRVSRHANDTVVVTSSSGIAVETFIRFLRPASGTRCFHGAALGSMGVGLSHGIGAAHAVAPHTPVWVFESDGGLWMNVQELATLRRHSPGNLTLFVMNNGGYGSIALSQRRLLDFEAGAGPDSGVFIPAFEPLAAAVGLRYRAVRSGPELEAVLQQGPRPDLPPMLVEVFVPVEERRGPQLRTVMGPTGPRTRPSPILIGS